MVISEILSQIFAEIYRSGAITTEPNEIRDAFDKLLRNRSHGDTSGSSIGWAAESVSQNIHEFQDPIPAVECLRLIEAAELLLNPTYQIRNIDTADVRSQAAWYTSNKLVTAYRDIVQTFRHHNDLEYVLREFKAMVVRRRESIVMGNANPTIGVENEMKEILGDDSFSFGVSYNKR